LRQSAIRTESTLGIAKCNDLLDGLVGMGAGWSVYANAARGEVARVLWYLLAEVGD
jgi:hypothetical protein